jgi:methylmalonyl-CoA/ethylmalonyl-CoA epimerase
VRLLIGQGEPAGGGTILYYRVADIEVVHSTLEVKGVEFAQGPHLVARMKSHDLWLAFLKDPSGNTLALMEEKTRNAGEEKSE